MITGSVTSGLNEGNVYVEKYKEKFHESLGFIPFPGTLNLKMEGVFSRAGKVTISNPPFGKVDCLPILVGGKYKGAIVIPHKTRHSKEIVEIIAPINLREMLKLNNGDELTCELV
jgi:riboflavin kinase, archaea type